MGSEKITGSRTLIVGAVKNQPDMGFELLYAHKHVFTVSSVLSLPESLSQDLKQLLTIS